MPEDQGPDVVRLSLPADPDLRSVVEVTAGVLARRLRFADDVIATARATAGSAFEEIAGSAGDGLVEVEVHLLDAQLVLHVRADGASRSLTISNGPPSPPA